LNLIKNDSFLRIIEKSIFNNVVLKKSSQYIYIFDKEISLDFMSLVNDWM